MSKRNSKRAPQKKLKAALARLRVSESKEAPQPVAQGKAGVRAHGFPELTGVRGLAATMVFWHHYVPAPSVVGAFLYSFLQEMHMGVSVFFVLSGFLIYLRHSSTESFHRVSLIRYCFHLFARIYPMYFLVVVGMAAWQ